MKGDKSQNHLRELKEHLKDKFLNRVYDESRLKAGLTLEDVEKASTQIYENI